MSYYESNGKRTKRSTGNSSQQWIGSRPGERNGNYQHSSGTQQTGNARRSLSTGFQYFGPDMFPDDSGADFSDEEKGEGTEDVMPEETWEVIDDDEFTDDDE